MAFCRQCGEKLAEDDAFCESCGKPVAPPAPPTQSISLHEAAVVQPSRPKSKILVVAGAILGVTGLAVGSGVFILDHGYLPPSAQDYEAQVNESPSKLDDFVCLSNLDYSRQQVTVNPFDGVTKEWLDMLVGAGLYSGPQTITTSNGWFSSTMLRYERTNVGTKAVHGNRLCYASKIAVESLTYDRPPAREKGLPPIAVGHAVVRFVDLAPWAASAAAKTLMPGQFGKPSIKVTLSYILRDGRWVESTGSR
jgi:hypothetical protein